jgi:endonuclease/exonuclease/phosphatase family metal-dependent hydrolase
LSSPVRILSLCAILVLASNLACAQKATDNIAVMTFNVRYGTAKDSLNSWPYRKEIFINCIRDNRPDILCVQEALDFQIAYIQAAFPTMRSVGVGRYQGVPVPDRPHETMAGESCNILFDSTKFDLKAHGTFWHSDTPEIPASMTWGNNMPRITTWGLFRDRASGLNFAVMNTHFHWNEPYVTNAAELNMRYWRKIAGTLPTIFTGDFNMSPDSPAHRLFCGQAGPPGLLGAFRDCWQLLGKSEVNAGTSSGFSGRKDKARIDWILATKQFAPLEIQIIYYNEQGRYPSDHFPVRAELKLKGE